jgi:hypothetical protein
MASSGGAAGARPETEGGATGDGVRRRSSGSRRGPPPPRAHLLRDAPLPDPVGSRTGAGQESSTASSPGRGSGWTPGGAWGGLRAAAAAWWTPGGEEALRVARGMHSGTGWWWTSACREIRSGDALGI